MWITINKKIGETPLDCIKRLKKENNSFKDIPMTYAGRLDPLAEGELIILGGEDVHRKDEFTKLDKCYEFSVLFGVSTDTGDLMGLIKNKVDGRVPEINGKDLKEKIQKMVGVWNMKYPVYSSKNVDGKPLFQYARDGKLPQNIPTKEVEIKSIEQGEIKTLSSNEVLKYMENVVSKVSGDFRQEEIIKKWNQTLNPEDSFQVVEIKTTVSSGAYMRALAERIGELFGVPALAYYIKRTAYLNLPTQIDSSSSIGQ